MRRVAITGIGAVHPHGDGRAALASALEAGAPPATTRHEAFDFKAHFPKSSKRIKRMDMVGKYAACAASLALADAGLEAPPDPVRAALVTGTMFGGLEACEAFHRELLTEGPDGINPVHFPNTAHNVACGHVAITLGLKGPVLALASGSGAGLEALAAATRMIATGRADLVLCGGFDRWIPALGKAFERLGLKGMRPAEGACFLVLEEESAARARGADVLGTVLGYGQASDPSPAASWDPQGKALVRALGLALQRADGAPDLVARSSGLCGLTAYDEAVEAAYRTVLAEGLDELDHVRSKGALGETFGAAGVFAVAAALLRARQPGAPRGSTVVDAYAWGGAATAMVVRPQAR